MNMAVENEKTHSAKEKAEMLLAAAMAKKAQNPVLLKLAKLSSLTDYFLIVTARSGRHVKAVADAILEDARSRGIPPYSVEGITQGHWALLDYGDVIVHVFFEPTREFYDLEGLWAEAPREKLPDDILKELEEAAGRHEEEEW